MQELGMGLYTLGEASRLLGVDRRSIKRWLFGYDFLSATSRGLARHHSEPLWRPQYTPADLGEPVIGFHDLLELRIVHRFVSHGVPLIIVRRCLDTAKEIFGADYPFTRQRFATDGETIFHEALEASEDGEGEMLNLKSRQYTFREIIKDSLYAGVEYDTHGAARWFPQARSRIVMLDPSIQFGHPSLSESGIPTASLYASFLAEGRSAANVARLFEVPARQVSAAVRFEERLRQAA